MALRRVLAVAAASAFVLAACQPAAVPTPEPATPVPATPEPATPQPATPQPATPAPTPEAVACTPQDPNLKNPGRLTIGTGEPAYPPYFDFPAEGEEPATPANREDPWSLGDPTNKRGFEAAVAWAIAERMGFSDDQVDWIAVEWAESWAPGPKDFDYNLNQTSFRPERTEGTDMSEGYYFLNQALVANAGTPITQATTIEELREYRLGAQVGTTSLAYIEANIQPTTQTSIYDSNDAAIAALNAEQIDGIVVDLPTAFFITAAQMETGDIVGQFPAAEGEEQEYFSVVLELDSPFTDCVNQMLQEMKADGSLEAITQEWMADKADAPYIQP
jgi:polar amino acid transport system substrate-binding protein